MKDVRAKLTLDGKPLDIFGLEFIDAPTSIWLNREFPNNLCGVVLKKDLIPLLKKLGVAGIPYQVVPGISPGNDNPRVLYTSNGFNITLLIE